MVMHPHRVFRALLLTTIVGVCAEAVGGTPEYRITSSRILVEDPAGMPALAWAPNGDLLLAYATNWQPIPPAGGTVKLMRSSNGGRTWTEPSTVVTPDDPTQASIHMWSGLHTMPDGSMILAYGQNYSEDVAEAYLIRSTDSGQSWDLPMRLADEPVDWGGEQVVVPFTEGFGHPVTAPNGDVLVPIGARIGGGFYGNKAAAFVRWDHADHSWGPLEYIATGPEKFSEVSMGVAADGDIVAVIRCDTTRRKLWQSASADNGQSWTTPAPTVAVDDPNDYVHGKMPDVLAQGDRMLMAVGSVDVNDGGDIWDYSPDSTFSGIYVSDDGGGTWRRDVMFESADPGNLIWPVPIKM